MTETLFRQIVRQYDPYVKTHLGGAAIHRAAAWGNAYEESGGFLHLLEKPGSQLGGEGGWQETGPRRRQLEQFAADQGTSPLNIPTEIYYFVLETAPRQANAKYAWEGAENHAWKLVLLTTTLEAATFTFTKKWERPAPETEHDEIRLKGAQIALSVIEELEGQKQMDDTRATPFPTAQNPLPPANPMASPPVQHPDILSALNAISAHLHMINQHLPNLSGVLQALPQIAGNPAIGMAAAFFPGLRAVVPFIQMAANAAPAIEQAVPQVLAAMQAIAKAFDEAKAAVK